ncbi:MAG: YceI family protein [Saprospiraceae bacterium]|nr:YceI family protein [Saprospiraceae bacterium]
MKIHLIICIGLFLFFSCKREPSANTSVKDAPGSELSQMDSFYIDPTQSIIYWQGSSPSGAHNGSIKIKSGKLYSKDKILKAGIVLADMNSLKNLDLEDSLDRLDLEKHLKDADFFQTDSFPEARFSLSSITMIQDTTYNAIVHGYLTVKDVMKPLQLKCKIDHAEDAILISVPEFSLDRTQYNIMYQSKKILASLKNGFIGDEINLSMKVIARSGNR